MTLNPSKFFYLLGLEIRAIKNKFRALEFKKKQILKTAFIASLSSKNKSDLFCLQYNR